MHELLIRSTHDSLFVHWSPNFGTLVAFLAAAEVVGVVNVTVIVAPWSRLWLREPWEGVVVENSAVVSLV